jgi:hypothetical protein
MEARGWWLAALWGAVGGAVAFGASIFFREPEPARIALELADVACGASAGEQRRVLAEHVEGTLEVEIDESGSDDGEPTEFDRLRAGLSADRARAKDGSSEFAWTQTELAMKLAELNALSPHCRLSLHDYSLHDGNDGSEWLDGDLDFSAAQLGDLHAERRRVRAQFRRSGSELRLERLLLGPVERRVPEARP